MRPIASLLKACEEHCFPVVVSKWVVSHCTMAVLGVLLGMLSSLQYYTLTQLGARWDACHFWFHPPLASTSRSFGLALIVRGLSRFAGRDPKAALGPPMGDPRTRATLPTGSVLAGR